MTRASGFLSGEHHTSFEKRIMLNTCCGDYHYGVLLSLCCNLNCMHWPYNIKKVSSLTGVLNTSPIYHGLNALPQIGSKQKLLINPMGQEFEKNKYIFCMTFNWFFFCCICILHYNNTHILNTIVKRFLPPSCFYLFFAYLSHLKDSDRQIHFNITER